MGSREVLVGTRERDFDSLLPRNSINNTILDTNNTLKESQPCFVCSFRWVLNGGPAGVESSSNEKEKKIDVKSGVEGQIEEKGGVVESRVGAVDSDEPGGGDEGGDKDSVIVSGEKAKEVDVSDNAGLQVR